MANFDPNQPRDRSGMWVSGSPYAMNARGMARAHQKGMVDGIKDFLKGPNVGDDVQVGHKFKKLMGVVTYADSSRSFFTVETVKGKENLHRSQISQFQKITIDKPTAKPKVPGSPYSMKAENAKGLAAMGAKISQKLGTKISDKQALQDVQFMKKLSKGKGFNKSHLDTFDTYTREAFVAKYPKTAKKLGVEFRPSGVKIERTKNSPRANTAEWANRNKGTATILSRQAKGDTRYGKPSQVTVQNPKSISKTQKEQAKILYSPPKSNKTSIALGVKAQKGGYTPAGKQTHKMAVTFTKNFGAKIEKPRKGK